MKKDIIALMPVTILLLAKFVVGLLCREGLVVTIATIVQIVCTVSM